MNRFVFSAVGVALFTMACGSSGSSGTDGSGTNKTASTLAYTSPCAPTTCSDSPVGDDNGVATCSTDASGTCGWAPGSPGSTPPSTGGGTTGGSPGSPGTSSGGEPGSGGSGDPGTGGGTSGSGGGDPGGGTTSFAPCDASACTAIPAVACAPGYRMETPECGSLNGGACAYIIECSPEVTGTCSDDQCGGQEDIARICDDGSTGTMVCTKTTAGCSWLDECPGDPNDPIGL